LLKRRINFASGFEAATQVREPNLPTFAETIPFTHIEGTTVGAGGRTLLFLKSRDWIGRSKRRRHRVIYRPAFASILSLLSGLGGSKPEAYEN
jgi:hypothetical protein